MDARIEQTRALVESGFPDALTVDPEDLRQLREEQRLKRQRPFKVALAVALVCGVVLSAFFWLYLMLSNIRTC
jgi:hypothetical protein